MSKTDTFVRNTGDGRKTPIRPRKLAPMTDAEVEARAASDPDNPPLDEYDAEQLKAVPRVKTLRRALGLTQDAFAARYGIPVGTLRDWEQGRSKPDKTARSYLQVIAADPEGVANALKPAA